MVALRGVQFRLNNNEVGNRATIQLIPLKTIIAGTLLSSIIRGVNGPLVCPLVNCRYLNINTCMRLHKNAQH